MYYLQAEYPSHIGLKNQTLTNVKIGSQALYNTIKFVCLGKL